jgi:hypothetical protein
LPYPNDYALAGLSYVKAQEADEATQKEQQAIKAEQGDIYPVLLEYLTDTYAFVIFKCG